MLNNHNYQLDSEEQDILDAYENGKLNGPPVSDTMVLAAKNTAKRGRTLTNDIGDR